MSPWIVSEPIQCPLQALLDSDVCWVKSSGLVEINDGKIVLPQVVCSDAATVVVRFGQGIRVVPTDLDSNVQIIHCRLKISPITQFVAPAVEGQRSFDISHKVARKEVDRGSQLVNRLVPFAKSSKAASCFQMVDHFLLVHWLDSLGTFFSCPAREKPASTLS